MRFGPVVRDRAFLAILAVTLVWDASLVVAPASLEPGTVMGLSGAANGLDYWPLWSTLPPYPMAVYAFGDMQCHQMVARSLTVNGNQMPIDARMTAMYFAAPLGLLHVAVLPASWAVSDVMVGILPAAWRKRLNSPRRRTWAAGAVLFLGVLSVAVDGFTQLLTAYESTNLTRVLTGIPAGYVGGLWMGAMLVSLQAMWRPALAQTAAG